MDLTEREPRGIPRSPGTVGLVTSPGRYGLFGDLSLGLIGGSIAIWIYQATGLAAYTGIFGGMVAAFMSAVGIALAQRKLWSLWA